MTEYESLELKPKNSIELQKSRGNFTLKVIEMLISVINGLPYLIFIGLMENAFESDLSKFEKKE